MTDERPPGKWMTTREIREEFGWRPATVERVVQKCRQWREPEGRIVYALRADVERADRDGLVSWTSRAA